jgi:hypothetical protein
MDATFTRGSRTQRWGSPCYPHQVKCAAQWIQTHRRRPEQAIMGSAGSLRSSEVPVPQVGAAEAVTDPRCMPVACVARPVLAGTAFDLLKGLRPSLMQAHPLQHLLHRRSLVLHGCLMLAWATEPAMGSPATLFPSLGWA